MPNENNLFEWLRKLRLWGRDTALSVAAATAPAALWVTYHNNPIATPPATPTGAGNLDGWHTTPTGSEVWISMKRAAAVADGTWSTPVLFKGATGGSGNSVWLCYCEYPPTVTPTKPADSSDGSTAPWYTAARATSVWMCQKLAPTAATETPWSAPILMNSAAAGDPTLVPQTPVRRHLLTGAASPALPAANTSNGAINVTAGGTAYNLTGLVFNTYSGDSTAAQWLRVIQELNLAFANAGFPVIAEGDSSAVVLKCETGAISVTAASGTDWGTALKLTAAYTPTAGEEWVMTYYSWNEAAWSTADSIAAPTGDGNTSPWSATRGAAAKWQSSKREATRSAGTWGTPEPISGAETGAAPVRRTTLTGAAVAESQPWPANTTFEIRISNTTYNVTGVTLPATQSTPDADLKYRRLVAKNTTDRLAALAVPATAIWDETAERFVFRADHGLTLQWISAASDDLTGINGMNFTAQDATWKSYGTRGAAWAWHLYTWHDNAWSSPPPADPVGTGANDNWYTAGDHSAAHWRAHKLEAALSAGWWWDGKAPI